MKKTFGQIAYETFTTPEGWTVADEEYKARWEAAAAAVIAAQWRPVTEPPEDEADTVVVAGGHPAGAAVFKCRSGKRTHWMPIPPLPPEPIDPYAELRQAHAAGDVIQWHHDVWKDFTSEPVWSAWPVVKLRIKPWTLSSHLPGFRPLEPGEEWHPTPTPWTEEDLQGGYRPAIKGERGRVEFMESDGTWEETNPNADDRPVVGHCKYRTRHPLPPTKLELEIAEFNNWWNAQPMRAGKHRAECLEAWQAARVSKL